MVVFLNKTLSFLENVKISVSFGVIGSWKLRMESVFLVKSNKKTSIQKIEVFLFY